MADNTARIAEIKDLLQTGVKQLSGDNGTTIFDLDSLRMELRQLQQEDAATQCKRPVASSIYLGGF